MNSYRPAPSRPATVNAPSASVEVLKLATLGLEDVLWPPTFPEPSTSPMLTGRHFTTTPLPSGVAVTVPETSTRLGNSSSPPESEPLSPVSLPPSSALAVDSVVTGFTARIIAKVAPAQTSTMHIKPMSDLMFRPIIGMWRTFPRP